MTFFILISNKIYRKNINFEQNSLFPYIDKKHTKDLYHGQSKTIQRNKTS